MVSETIRANRILDYFGFFTTGHFDYIADGHFVEKVVMACFPRTLRCVDSIDEFKIRLVQLFFIHALNRYISIFYLNVYFIICQK